MTFAGVDLKKWFPLTPLGPSETCVKGLGQCNHCYKPTFSAGIPSLGMGAVCHIP